MPFKFKDRTGECFTTNEGYEVEILAYRGSKDCDVIFKDGTIIEHKEYRCVKEGSVKNPFHISVEGVGYYGQGSYKARGEDKEKTLVYNRWRHMLMRCYNKVYHKRQPTYKDCEVVEEWHNFQNFAKWFEENYVEGWDIDKDLIVKGNKVYGPETCCFVPEKINNILLKTDSRRGKYPIGVSKKQGFFRASIRNKDSKDRLATHLGSFNTPEEAFQAYKEAKEKYIKEVAEEYKDIIDDRVYNTLINHRVQITD